MYKTEDPIEKSLISALNRLMNGNPINVTMKKGSPISVNMLAKEAVIGGGTLYYEKHRNFLKHVQEKIASYNQNPSAFSSNIDELDEINELDELQEKFSNAEDKRKQYKRDYLQSEKELTLLRNEIGVHQHTIFTLNSDYHTLVDLFKEATGMSPKEYIDKKKQKTIPHAVR